MKICWDNLEKLKYRQDIGAWQDKWKHFYSYKENCKKCQNSFLSRNNNKYCCLICSSDSKIGNKNPAKRIEVRKKISKSKMGQKLGIKRPNHSKWMIENCPMKKPEISQKFIGENNPSYKHGFSGTKAFNNAKSAKRRGLKLNQTPPEADMEEINIIYKICSDMNRRAGRVLFHVDHIIPLSKNGLHHQDNLQILYARDNLSKASKILYEGEGYGKRIKD